MIGRTLSHFRILAKIGEGGMGVVYRAEDTDLRRPVALKVLPPDLVGNEERRLRFLREARAAAAVTHPNIATVYEVGDSDGVVFIAMELVEGKTLRDHIAGRSMPIKDALRIATEMAEGLAEAHKAGVIHRDFKPDNVIVHSNGHPKILDFGLAKLLEERDETTDAAASKIDTISREMTREGKIFGTALYMSPEQARGKQVDARSDIFSFGTTLYEMVTGRVPFQGKTNTDILSAIIRDEPVPPSQQNSEIPPKLEEIIQQCLEKDPQDRYLHTDQLAADLRKAKRVTDSGIQTVRTPSGPMVVPPSSGWTRLVGTGTRRALLMAALVVLIISGAITTWWIMRTPAGFKSGDRIIVADFENATNQPELSRSVRDAFEHMLAASKFVDVVRGERRRALIAKRVSGSFGRLDPDLADAICRDANLIGFITGDIARRNSGYRIEINLFRTGTARPEVSFSEEAASEQDILPGLHQLGLALRKALGESPQAIVATMPPSTDSLPAYQAFVMAEQISNEGTGEAEAEMIALWKRAIEIDPDFVEAYSSLGISYWRVGEYGLWRRMVEEAYRRSARLPEQARLWYEIDWLDVMYDYESEIERLKAYRKLFPSNSTAPNYLSVLYGFILDEDHAAAEGLARDAYTLSPDPIDLLVLLNILAQQGKVEEIEHTVADFRRRGGSERYATAGLALIPRLRGDWRGLMEVADRLERDLGASGSEVAELRLGAALEAGRLADAERYASDLGREALSERIPWVVANAWVSRAWLQIRRGGRPPEPPAEFRRLAKGSLGEVRQLVFNSFALGMAEPIERALRENDLLRTQAHLRYVGEEVQFARACLALLQNRLAEARVLLEPLVRNSKLRVRRLVLARTYQSLQSWNEAAAAYEQLLSAPHAKWLNAPLSILDQYRLAQIYERLNDTDRARHWYERFLTDWKDADPDIPELIEAKKRMAALGEIEKAEVQ